MRRLLAVLVFLAAACGSATASPVHLYGTVGKAPVFLDISHVGDTVSGWYIILGTGKQVRLDGKLDPTGFFQIEGYSTNTNERIGTFSGRRKDGHWSGAWRSPAKSLPVSFDELRSKLTEISGHYRCTGVSRDTEFGITVTEALDLKIARGRVKSLALSRSQKSDGEEQICRIPPGHMRQIPAPVGVLLRARADRADGSPHCTIRLYRAGDYLVVKPGDDSQAGDDCRRAGATTFCSPNGFWSDLVLNRKTQTCRPVR